MDEEQDRIEVNLSHADGKLIISFDVWATGESLLVLGLSAGAATALSIRILNEAQAVARQRDDLPPSTGRVQ